MGLPVTASIATIVTVLWLFSRFCIRGVVPAKRIGKTIFIGNSLGYRFCAVEEMKYSLHA